MWIWTVSYETATIARGEASTRQEAERACTIEHTRLELSGLNPDTLGYGVMEAR